MSSLVAITNRDRQTHTDTDRQTDRDEDRQTETERQTETDRYRDIETKRQKETDKKIERDRQRGARGGAAGWILLSLSVGLIPNVFSIICEPMQTKRAF